MKTSLENNEIPSLRNKTLMLSTWGCGDKDTHHCRDWIPLFKKMFGKLIVFASRNYHYQYGKKKLNSEFLRIIQKEKPDYLLFGPGFFGQFYIETLAKIKRISPTTKTIIEFGDDDWKFEDWSRYYALFFDYIITSKKEIEIYKNDGIKNVSFLLGVNPHFFKPMNLEKKYDVTFIGRPIADRYNYIKFLKENGVNIKLFGAGWQNYLDFKNIYQGVLYDEDYPRVINQSKININFSKTLYKKGNIGQLKGRVWEIPSCCSFMLNEFTEMNIDFINNKKEINFKSKEELLKKINYYLPLEQEREKLSKELYNYITKNHSWEILFQNFFKKIEKDKIQSLILPKINNQIKNLSKDDLELPLSELKNKLKTYDYITFFSDKKNSLRYRNYLQSYSLQITKKPISCCDYFIYSKRMGEYMVSLTKEAYHSVTSQDFHKFLNLNQLMVKKEFFLNNLNLFKKIYSGEEASLITEENTAFVSIPLVKVEKIPSLDYTTIKKIFHMNFIDDLASIFFQKKINSLYLIHFSLEFFRKSFIRKFLISYLMDTKSLSNILKTF